MKEDGTHEKVTPNKNTLQPVSKYILELISGKINLKAEDLIMEKDEYDNIVIRDRSTGQIIPKDI